MEKIFDIAKDSEQSWGTLSTAIDGNFDDTAKFLLADKIPCGDNLITQSAELSEGWSYENGIYTHASGYDNALAFTLTTSKGKKYLAKLTKGIEGSENSIMVGIGDKTPIDTYNGELIAYIGMISDGGSLKVFPSAKYASTLEVELYEVVDKSSASQLISYGRQNVYINIGDNDISSWWDVALGYKTLGKSENSTRCIGIGTMSLSELISGSRNIAIGTYSTAYIPSGKDNVAIGADTLYPCRKECNSNVAIGRSALGGTEHHETVGIGTGVLGFYTGAGSSQCVVIGHNASRNLVDSEVKTEGCTVVGYEAGAYGNQKNTYIGYKAGRYCKGSNNIMVGADNGGSVNQLNDVILLGNNTKASKDGQMILGSTAQTEVILLGNKKLIFNEDGSVTWEQV